MLIEQSAEKLNAQMPLQWRAWAETIFRSFDTTCTGELSAGHLSTLMSTILTVDKASDKQTLHALLETSGCSSTINLLCFERWLMLQFHELDDLHFAKFVHAMLTASPRGCELDFDELIGSIK